MRLPKINWLKWGEICLTMAGLIDCFVLILMAKTNKIYVMYIGYAIYRILYQCMITIAQ